MNIRIELKNEFHKTAVRLNAHIGYANPDIQRLWISRGQLMRANHELCGIEGCTCSGDLKVRGSQPLCEGMELNDIYGDLDLSTDRVRGFVLVYEKSE
jgi:hypothetical protein